MKPLAPEPYIKVYMLLKQQGLYLSTTGHVSGPLTGSIGFYQSYNEAEIARTHELLVGLNSSDYRYHIFELDLPNPAYDIQPHQTTQE